MIGFVVAVGQFLAFGLGLLAGIILWHVTEDLWQ